jgi:transposase-like protein
MDERTRFISEREHECSTTANGRANMAALCRAFGVSRQTGYNWLKRYLAAGRELDALADHSRRPLRSPLATPERVVNAILAARRMYPVLSETGSTETDTI